MCKHLHASTQTRYEFFSMSFFAHNYNFKFDLCPKKSKRPIDTGPRRISQLNLRESNAPGLLTRARQSPIVRYPQTWNAGGSASFALGVSLDIWYWGTGSKRGCVVRGGNSASAKNRSQLTMGGQLGRGGVGIIANVPSCENL